MDNFDLKKYLAEGRLNEKYTKDSLLKALGDDDDAFIVVGSDINNQFVIYNPNSNNQDNADMWGPESVFAVDEDGEEHEIKYSDIERVLKNYFPMKNKLK